MKKARSLALAAALFFLAALSACSNKPAPEFEAGLSEQPEGEIFLYGEMHGVESILDKEAELWRDYYENKNMRHLFLELPYYTAEFMNIWMRSDNDDILNQIYEDWKGSASHDPDVISFYKRIKNECPETIFHGTDVGHQYDTVGERYLKHLKANGFEGSEQYLLAQETVEQGKYFYANSDDVYRENKMAENFIREFDKLGGESAMGIYGSAHTGLDAMDATGSVPCMANQLKRRYGDAVHSEDLTYLAKVAEPIRTDILTVSGRDYEAAYFGKEDISSWSDEYEYREFWRLENAYEDFKDMPKAGDVLPYSNYPMRIEDGQVFVIDYIKGDGTADRMYYRSDGYVWKGLPSTEEFDPD